MTGLDSAGAGRALGARGRGRCRPSRAPPGERSPARLQDGVFVLVVEVVLIVLRVVLVVVDEAQPHHRRAKDRHDFLPMPPAPCPGTRQSSGHPFSCESLSSQIAGERRSSERRIAGGNRRLTRPEHRRARPAPGSRPPRSPPRSRRSFPSRASTARDASRARAASRSGGRGSPSCGRHRHEALDVQPEVDERIDERRPRPRAGIRPFAPHRPR